MLAKLYQAINWQAPWYRTLMITPCPTNFHHVKDWLNTAITPPIYNYQNQPIDFVAQDDLPANTAYETFIAHTGHIPTRDNFHDLLGGVIWLNYPNTKAVFNELHQKDIEQHGITAKRTPLRNLLTLFDENGGVVVSHDKTLLQDLQGFDWQSALFDKRQHWRAGQTAFFPIGHALLEKLITPRLPICGHCLLLQVDDDFLNLPMPLQRAKLDNWLSRFFYQCHGDLSSKVFQPLPILGIPDFYQPQPLALYHDKSVFRAGRNAPPAPIFSLQTL